MVRDALRDVLLELGIDDDQITDEAHLQGDLELDSTETVQIALELKRRFHVDVKLESSQDLMVRQVCDLVEAQLLKTTPGS